jgi:chitinase
VSIRPLLIVMLLVAVFTIPSSTHGRAEEEIPTDDYRIVGVFTSYSIYDREYFVTDIPADQLTHINYASIDISANGQCASSDTWADWQYSYPGDSPAERIRGNFKQLQVLRGEHPDLKILMSIGGWDQSANFSDVALNQQARIRFVRSCLAFMRDYGFDGIDIDWRYPVSGGAEDGRPADSENLTLLLAEFRGQLEYWSERDEHRYLLTITAPAVEPLYENIQLEMIHSDLDWINLTTYGFQGSWSDLASHHAPLYGSVRDPRGEVVREGYNVDGAVNAYLDAGVPAHKIVIGVPFYAQTWRNVPPSDYFGLYQPNDGVPTGTRPGGLLYYRDLDPFFNSDGYIRFFDDETLAPWMYNPERRIAISYENEESIINKANYVQQRGLGGMMLWELSYDNDAHTLVNSAYRSLMRNNNVSRP